MLDHVEAKDLNKSLQVRRRLGKPCAIFVPNELANFGKAEQFG